MLQTIDPREAEAVRITLHGSLGERLRLAVSALRGILNDPEDTHQVFILGMMANLPMFPFLLTRIALDAGGDRLLRERPSIDSEHVDFEALRRLPEDALGGAYIRWLDSQGVDADFFQPPPGLPAIPTYISQRLRQTHDLWHVLTGYDTSVKGELALQAFTFGQLGMPSPGLIALFGTLRFAAGDHGIPRLVAEGFQRGRRAKFLPVVVFEDLWEEPLAEVRSALRLGGP